MNTQRSSMKCFALVLMVTQKGGSNLSLRKLGLEWSLRERRFELKREYFKVFASEASDQTS
jgi:hypothetical protein